MFATAFDVVGHTVEIAKIEDKHIGPLWTLLQEEENIRLYRQLYHIDPTSEEDLGRDLLASSQNNADTKATRAIINKYTSDVLGWLIVRSQDPDTSAMTAEAAMFLPRALRSERGTETMYYVSHTVFDNLDYEKLEFRAGTSTEAWGPGGGQLGRSLIGVSSRQMLDRSRSAESDLFVVMKAQWPVVSLAIGAWLDSKGSAKVE
ncbi:hypothetical protein LTR86_003292 [Recurvomyces mirabilis]|nr:hypothetical protein LTR86_003292 [Recurvomyces mirabilis]